MFVLLMLVKFMCTETELGWKESKTLMKTDD